MTTNIGIKIYEIKVYFRMFLKEHSLEDVTFEQVEANPIGFLYHHMVRSSWDYDGTVVFEGVNCLNDEQQAFIEKMSLDLNLIFGSTGGQYYLSTPISIF